MASDGRKQAVTLHINHILGSRLEPVFSGKISRLQHQNAVELTTQGIGIGHLGVVGARVFRGRGMARDLGRRAERQA